MSRAVFAMHFVGESKDLRDMLSNPHLVRMLCHLDTTPRPDRHLEAAMHEPIFTEFVDECLRIVEPPTKWRASFACFVKMESDSKSGLHTSFLDTLLYEWLHKCPTTFLFLSYSFFAGEFAVDHSADFNGLQLDNSSI